MKKLILGLMLFATPLAVSAMGIDADGSNPFNVERVNIPTSASVNGGAGAAEAAAPVAAGANEIKPGTIGFVNVNS